MQCVAIGVFLLVSFAGAMPDSWKNWDAEDWGDDNDGRAAWDKRWEDRVPPVRQRTPVPPAYRNFEPIPQAVQRWRDRERDAEREDQAYTNRCGREGYIARNKE